MEGEFIEDDGNGCISLTRWSCWQASRYRE
jgi:hypothetical protein